MRINNFNDYEVNVKNGTIFSYKRNCFIGNMHPRGYILSTITDDNGVQHSIKFHRFIWECVNGKIPEGFDIHHKHGDKLNNSIFNLELMGRFEHNHLHKSEENHPMYGKKVSDETREKMSKSHIGKRYVPIVQLTMGGDYITTYSSVKEAGEKTNIPTSSISNVINHKAIHAGHFKWMKLTEYEESK